MALERKRALVEDSSGPIGDAHGRVGLDVVYDQRVVQPNLHLLCAYEDVQPEPLVVFYERFVDVADAIKRAGLLALNIIRVPLLGVVDLYLEAIFEPAY